MENLKSNLSLRALCYSRYFVPLSYLLLVTGVGLEIFAALGILFQERIREYQEINFLGVGIYFLLALLLFSGVEHFYRPSEKSKLPLGMILVFFPSLLLYLSSQHSMFPGDSIYNVLLPHYLLGGGGLPIDDSLAREHEYWGLIKSGDGFMPMWAVGASLFLFPTAFIQHLFLGSDELLMFSAWNQKVVSALITSLINLVLYYILKNLKINRTIICLTLIGFSLSGSQLLISAQTFWQHGVTTLLIVLAIHFLFLAEQKAKRSYLYLVSFILSFLPFVRQQTGLFLVAGFLYVLIKHPRAIVGFIVCCLPMGLFALGYNYYWFEDLLGGYRILGHTISLNYNCLTGFLGLFFAPNRGVFIFSPFLLLFFLGLQKSNRSFLLTTFFIFSLLYTFAHTLHGRWDAGWCNGPRFLTESAPILALLCAIGLNKTSRNLTVLYAVGVVAAVIVSLPGFYYPLEQTRWSAFPDINKDPNRAWALRGWLPIHFINYVNFSNGKETPAYVFTDSPYVKPLSSKKYNFDVSVPPASKDTLIFRVIPVVLSKGKYQIVIKGTKETPEDLLIKWKTDVRWQNFWESESIINQAGEFESRNSFEVFAKTNVSSLISVKSKDSFTARSLQIVGMD